MDKKSKDALRRYKKSRHTHSSSDSSSSDTDTGSSSSYSSSDSEHHNRVSERHHRKKKSRRANSSSGDERRKRDKRDHCQKKLEAKRNHLKRKLKEAKLKKRAAAAAAALSGHGHRSLSPATQAKLKKLAERKHLRAASKERREREREKLRAVQRDRERDHHRLGSSRSPTTTTKIRIHQDIKRQKSPGGMGSSSSSSRMHHQLMSREKIIIQTRTRERTPSMERDRERIERQRHDHKLQRHDELSLRDRERRDRERERAEREAARDKERAEALARCQERQRERERLAREKLRREEEEKKYGVGSGGSGGDRMRQLSEREIDMPGGPYGSRERSLENVERTRHMNKRDIDPYEREPDYMEQERHGMMDDVRRYGGSSGGVGGGHRRREMSPIPESSYPPRIREPREMYPDEERERVYKRNYMDVRYSSRERENWMETRELREHDMHDPRDFRDPDDSHYPDERERVMRERERNTLSRNEWKNEWERNEWDEGNGAGSGVAGTPGRAGGFVGGPKRNLGKPQSNTKPQPQQRAGSESNWDTDEQDTTVSLKNEPTWLEHDSREKPQRPWQNNDWRDTEEGYAGVSGNSNVGMGVGRGVGAPESSHIPPHQQQSPTPHHMHPRSERGGRGFRRGGGMHGDHMGERNAPGYRPHLPPLMTLPVQPPGGYGSSRGFPHKRLTYTNPGYGKKHPIMLQQQHSPQPGVITMKSTPASSLSSSSAAQASAVAAATTAVAAAKAAAQSTANAVTNPGILAQVSKPPPPCGKAIGSAGANYTADIEVSGVKTDIAVGADDKRDGELSEISDSDDDILNKTDKVVKPKLDEVGDEEMEVNTLDTQAEAVSSEESKPETTVDNKPEDEEVLDFEEISDGELEEDARHKGIGDALGVDWQGLIAETREQAAEYANGQDTEQSATGKQRWQPHRILLDVGVSLRMAGSYYGKQLLHDARQKLQEESDDALIKSHIKREHADKDTDASTNAKKVQQELSTAAAAASSLDDYNYISSAAAEPLACIQVGTRREANERHKLVANVCGPNSRALSARQDLKLRRQLCALPARECEIPSALPVVSDKLKSMALHVFQRHVLDVK